MERKKLHARSIRPSNVDVVRRQEFWDGLWTGTVSRDVLHAGIKNFHDETVRIVLSLDGKPATYARKHILQDPGSPNSPTLSDAVYRCLGDRGRGFNPRSAGTSAIAGRQHAYSAAIHDPKYDNLPDDEVRSFFRKCSTRAEFDLLEAIESASRHRGASLDLGRP